MATKKIRNNASMAKNRKKPINLRTYALVLCVFVVLCLVIIAVSVSFALYRTTTSIGVDNYIEAGCMKFSFNDYDENENATNINLDNSYPMNDEAGLKLKPYVFTITNTCTLDTNFNIYLHTLASNTLPNKYINYNFYKNGETSVVSNLSILEPIVLEDNMYITGEYNIGEVQDTFLLDNITLKPEETMTYNFQAWINESADNSIMNKTFEAAFSAIASAQ